MNDFSEEEKGIEIQEGILRAEFKDWLKILEEKGQEGDAGGSEEREIWFAIDRNRDKESQFTADAVIVRLHPADKTLEDFLDIDPNVLKSQIGERWIRIEVAPKDPYQPKIGKWEHDRGVLFVVENVAIYLSSLGRGFEETAWSQTLPPKHHNPESPSTSYMKKYPDEYIKFDKNPIDEDLDSELEVINGQTLERLEFLKAKLQTGQVTIRSEDPTIEHS